MSSSKNWKNMGGLSNGDLANASARRKAVPERQQRLRGNAPDIGPAYFAAISLSAAT